MTEFGTSRRSSAASFGRASVSNDPETRHPMANDEPSGVGHGATTTRARGREKIWSYSFFDYFKKKHMAANKFKLSLLQAVSDWQRSSTEKRAAALKEQCASLPPKFRTSVKRCYRQVGLTKGFVWDLIADDCLREKVSSWTLSYPVAMTFKNGVPPQGSGYQGVIVAIERPASAQIIVNISRLYKDRDFLAAMEANKASISGYAEGAGRYKGESAGNRDRDGHGEQESDSLTRGLFK
ncbi:hypothetical protein OJJOAM_004726 [Cupriavidus sp. H18C1]|uniref:hypothetical protein n=1 Tax=Cupriavidus sp. H18C1 TaxID=3241601 RepID=UPI003BB92E16